MKNTFEQSRSIWMNSPVPAPAPQSTLGKKVSADVCIVGAGIAGMSTSLAKASPWSSSTTGRSAAG